MSFSEKKKKNTKILPHRFDETFNSPNFQIKQESVSPLHFPLSPRHPRRFKRQSWLRQQLLAPVRISHYGNCFCSRNCVVFCLEEKVIWRQAIQWSSKESWVIFVWISLTRLKKKKWLLLLRKFKLLIFS